MRRLEGDAVRGEMSIQLSNENIGFGLIEFEGVVVEELDMIALDAQMHRVGAHPCVRRRVDAVGAQCQRRDGRFMHAPGAQQPFFQEAALGALPRAARDQGFKARQSRRGEAWCDLFGEEGVGYEQSEVHCGNFNTALRVFCCGARPDMAHFALTDDCSNGNIT